MFLQLKRKYYLLFVTIAFSFAACTDSSNKQEAIIKQMEENLTSSNQAIYLSTVIQLRNLERKATDPASAKLNEPWFSKAKAIADLSNKIYIYLEDTKTALKENRLSTQQLYQELSNYTINVLALDKSIYDNYKNEFNFPRNVANLSSSAELSLIQTSVRIFENKLILDCDSQVTESALIWNEK